MTNPRKHHFVSQAYLGGFAKEPRKKKKKRLLTSFDVTTGEEFSTNTGDVGAERDFNRIESDPEDPNFLEKQLSELEGKIPLAIRSIAETQTLSEDTLSVILTIIALYYMRNPALRKKIHEHHERAIKMLFEHSVHDQESFEGVLKYIHGCGYDSSGKTRENIREQLISGEFKLEPDQDFLIDTEMEQIIPIAGILAERQWALLTAGVDTGNFITSDRPVGIEYCNPEIVPRLARNSPGLAVKDTLIWFPLNRNCAVVGSFEGYFRNCKTTPEIVAHVNSQMISNATKQIYYYPEEGYKFRSGKNLVPHTELPLYLKK